MKYLVTMIMLAVIFCCEVSSAKELHTQAQVEELTRKAMANVGAGNIGALFDQLQPSWPLGEEEYATARKQTVTKRELLVEKFGTVIEVQHLTTEVVADSLMRIVYLEKLQKHAVVWEFLFYKAEKEWELNTFAWDKNLKQLFED